MSIETVAVAGGSGKIGREILDILDEEGYRIVNLDRHPTDDHRADEFVRVDLLDAGQVASAFGQWDADAAIHMGTIPTPNARRRSRARTACSTSRKRRNARVGARPLVA